MNVINIFLTAEDAEGFEDFAHDGCRYIFGQLTTNGPDQIIEGPIWIFVDWVMADMAGLEMCRRLRADARTSDAHITMVLDQDDAEDRRRALKAGADDYLLGPIDRTIVLDRVLALRSGQIEQHVSRRLELGALKIDLAAMQARWMEIPVTLRPNEFRLLRFFAEHPNVICSRETIIAGLGKNDPPLDERTVDVWIGRLRKALRAAGAGNPLRTVRSRGYVFDVI